MSTPDIRDYASLSSSREVVVKRQALPLHCPTEDSALWCGHPRVFLAIEASADNTVRCPYCGTLYRLLD